MAEALHPPPLRQFDSLDDVAPEIASLQACTSQLPVLGDVMNRNTHLGLARPTGPHICGEGVGQGYSITNSVGPDFQNKKFSWARHFQLQVMTHFGPTQMNVLKYTNVLLTVISEKLHSYIFGESDLGKTLQTK